MAQTLSALVRTRLRAYLDHLPFCPTQAAIADAGADHLDIAAVLGHRDARTTREHYIGILESRTRAALARLDGRVDWTPPPVETSRGNAPQAPEPADDRRAPV